MGVASNLMSATGLPRLAALMGFGGRHYDAGRSDTRELGAWTPTIASSAEEILSSRDQIVARARDLIRNNPTISGGIDRLCESVIGARMWLEAQPDYEAMGRTPEWADKWATDVEARFRVWANDPWRRCDADRKARFPEMLRTGYRHWLIDGEACGLVMNLKRGGKFATAIKLIDPDRLSNPQEIPDETVLANGNICVGGVEILKSTGEVVAYYIRNAHPASVMPTADRFTWTRIERYGRTGRPQFIHAFRADRADQRRGVSRLAAAMERIKMSDRYDKAELDAALLNAVMAAFVTSAAPGSDVRDMIAPGSEESTSGWFNTIIDYRKEQKVRVPGLQVGHLLPGEKFDMNQPARPAANYPNFAGAQDRKIAGAMGLSYPHLSQNWADINYSSGRLMKNEMWRGFLEDRELFTQEFATPFYAAWMEEAVALGEIKVPGGPANFYRWAPEMCQGEWMGPGPGSGDPKKEAEANDLELRQNTTTLAIIAADKGINPRQTLVKRAREIALLKSLGLTDVTETQSMAGPGRPPDPTEPGDGNGDQTGPVSPENGGPSK